MPQEDISGITRRRLLRQAAVAGAAFLGLGLTGCGGAANGETAPTSNAASPAQVSAGAPNAAGEPKPVASWDEMVAAAKREGKVIINGPPDPDTRDKLPAAFKARFGIDVEYLTASSSQAAARLQAERSAGQYTLDAMLVGADTVYGTLVPSGWLDPIKPTLLLPEVADGSHWRAGHPWMRDPKEETVLQLFNTVQPTMTLNTQLVNARDVPNADALLDPKWKGKIGAFDPSVNGIGLAIAASLYVAKGKDFATRLYQGQKIVITSDYQQLPDWLAHGSYPIGLAVGQNYLDVYRKAGITFEAIELPDAPSSTGGGFGLVCLLNRAPHPNAARVFVNWIASKEGLSLYSQTQAQAPARGDIDASWMPAELIPKPNVQYLDTYEFEFVTKQRVQIRDFFAALLK